MARVPVIEVHCDRCPSVEYVPVPAGQEPPKPRTFTAKMGGDDPALSFEELCNPCAEIIKGYLALIAKKSEKTSSVRKKKEADPTPPKAPAAPKVPTPATAPSPKPPTLSPRQGRG
jgi:hypothetical protein